MIPLVFYLTQLHVDLAATKFADKIAYPQANAHGGGTAMFTFSALAGDLGAMASPVMVGTLSEMAGGNLKTGLFADAAFPIVIVFVLLALKSQKQRLAKGGK